jgi:hypothetical protein
MALQAAENTHVYLYRSLKAFKNGRQPAHRWHAAINVMASSQHCASRQPAICWQAASALMANSHRKSRWKGFDHSINPVRYFGSLFAACGNLRQGSSPEGPRRRSWLGERFWRE